MKQRLIELANQLKFKQGDTAYVRSNRQVVNHCKTCGNTTRVRTIPCVERVTVIGAELRVLETDFYEVWYEVRHADRCTQQFRANDVYASKEYAKKVVADNRWRDEHA